MSMAPQPNAMPMLRLVSAPALPQATPWRAGNTPARVQGPMDIAAENHASAGLSAVDARWVLAVQVARNLEGGKAAAQLLIATMGDKGKVALLTGVPGAFNLEERIRGFKDGIKERLAEVKRAVKELAKLAEERTERLAEVNAHADRYVAQVKEASADLAEICANPEKAKRHFTVAERPEIAENEFNLNLPRYVDTFEPEEEVTLESAASQLQGTLKESKKVLASLQSSLSKSGIKFDF